MASGASGRPNTPFNHEELSSSLGQAAAEGPQHGGSSDTTARTAASRSPGQPFSMKTVAMVVLGGALAIALASMIVSGLSGITGGSAFPSTGEFRIRPDYADAPLGKLALGAGNRNLAIQLYGRDGQAVFVGFVRANEYAVLEVPAGKWRSLVVQTDTWDGTLAVVSDQEFSRLGTVVIERGKQANISAEQMGFTAEKGAGA